MIVCPGHGARILRWERKGREIITWPEDADWSRVLKVRGGNPILFPFVARHFVDGRMEFWRDNRGTVRPMPMHGFARNAPFTVVEEAGETVRLRLTDSDATRPDYPFAFQFDVVVRLHPASRLEVRFETTNRGDQPLPYYPGHHFYFAIPHGERADWSLHLPCAAWGRQNEDGSIRHEKAASASLRLDDPALVDRFHIGPLGETFALENARAGRRLILELASSIPWFALTTWTSAPESDFYCLEPWLGLPNAIHHGEGLRWLQPGATETATCILDGSSW